MEPQDIIQALTTYGDHFPREALEAAIAQPEAITPHLLAALEDAPALLARLQADPEYMLPFYAFFLLAQFRETRAYPLIVDFFAIPGEAVHDVTGDFLTESLAGVLASVSGGDMAPMRRLAENPEANEYVRSSAFGAMTALVAESVVPREEVIAYFRSLFAGGLPRAFSYAWSSLVVQSMHLYPEELMPEIRQAFADDLIDDMDVDLAYVEQILARGQDETLRNLRRNRHYRFIDDAMAEMAWADEGATLRPEPLKSAPPPPQRKIGRNEPCPCGSGRKYKRCHGRPGA
jgi:hypothetical protein